MVAVSTHPLANPSLPQWAVMFAREPEPDLDFEEDLEDLDDTPSRSYSPKSPRKSSGRGPLLWILLLVIVVGGGYLAMEPEVAVDLLSPFFGETTPPPMVVKPPPKPSARIPPTKGGAGAPQTSPKAAPPGAGAVPSPQFREGQQVSVILDPAAPGGALSLSADPSGARPGPKVKPGATLVVVDGELKNNTWVYSVQTQGGAKGWIAEKRLVPKP